MVQHVDVFMDPSVLGPLMDALTRILTSGPEPNDMLFSNAVWVFGRILEKLGPQVEGPFQAYLPYINKALIQASNDLCRAKHAPNILKENVAITLAFLCRSCTATAVSISTEFFGPFCL
jgi:hypothetical protein